MTIYRFISFHTKNYNSEINLLFLFFKHFRKLISYEEIFNPKVRRRFAIFIFMNSYCGWDTGYWPENGSQNWQLQMPWQTFIDSQFENLSHLVQRVAILHLFQPHGIKIEMDEIEDVLPWPLCLSWKTHQI